MTDKKDQLSTSVIDFHKTLSIIDGNHMSLHYDDIEDGEKGTELPNIESHIETIQHLGTGGIGIVYTANQCTLDRIVAYKQLKINTAHGIQSLLEHEAKIMGRLEHPNILPVHLYGLMDGRPTMVMKRLQGESWREKIERHPSTASTNDIIQCIRILQEVGKAVSYAHKNGIIHRDIKPENIHLGDNGEVFLLDWGLSIPIRGQSIFPVSALLGTPAYMPPEMAAANVEKQNESTDVYLLGATLYEAILNRSPHQGESVHEVVDNILNTHYIDIPTHLPERLQYLFIRSMAYDPIDRYPSVDKFLEALEQVKGRLQNLPIIRSIQNQSSLILYSIKHEIFDWEDNVDGLILGYQSMKEGFFDLNLDKLVQSTLEEGIRTALKIDNLRLAQKLFVELPHQNIELNKQLNKAEDDKQKNLIAYSQWTKQNDPSHGQVYRLWATSCLTLIWASISWILYELPEVEYKSSWGWGITLFVFIVFNKGFRITRINKNISYSIAMLVLCTISGILISNQLSADFTTRMAFIQMNYGIALGLMGILISRVFWAASIPFWVSGFLVAKYPEHNDVWTSASKSLAFGGMTLFWLIQQRKSI